MHVCLCIIKQSAQGGDAYLANAPMVVTEVEVYPEFPLFIKGDFLTVQVSILGQRLIISTFEVFCKGPEIGISHLMPIEKAMRSPKTRVSYGL